jgi:tetratricopeptide (TPR) repeat protein
VTQDKPPMSGTSHTLPFDKLSPHDFERLCLWLVEREEYEHAEHLGAAGSEQGRDIVAWREGKLWAFQCKRVQRFGPKDALKEVEKLLGLPQTQCLTGLVFIITCDVSANTRQKVRERCAGEIECHFWAETELDARVKRHPDMMAEFFQANRGSIAATGDGNIVGDYGQSHVVKIWIEGDVNRGIVATAGHDVIIHADTKIKGFPEPPAPYVAHPYPAHEHFTGREQERAELTAWLTDDVHPLLAVIAIGGMGKSALAWYWLHNDLLPLGLGNWDLRGALWWSFYDQKAGFERFLRRTIAYASSGQMDAEKWSVWDRMECLRTLLAGQRFLLVLDGAERLLRAYARMDAPYLGGKVGDDDSSADQVSSRQCADLNTGTFLQWLAGLNATKTLLTSRLLPRELEGLAGVARMNLTKMDTRDAVRFFQAMKIKGTRAEIQATCAPYGYLPLALRLLAGLVVEDPVRPGDIAVAAEYEVTKDLRGKERHHILERAYDALEPTAQELLSRIAAFRSPVGYRVLQTLFGPPAEETGEETFRFENEQVLKDTLRELIKRGLLSCQEGGGHYDLHPVVRHYAYDRLTDKEGTHTRLRDYFAAVPEPERVESLDDLAPMIELCHHTVCAGRYDEAFKLFARRLSNPLIFRLGALGTSIELLRSLCVDGEDNPPRLRDVADQGEALMDLALAYSYSGRLRSALQLYRASSDLFRKTDRKLGLAIILLNLAYYQASLGELREAEQNLLSSIKLRQEVGNKYREGIGHAELGRLLTFCGAFDAAKRELAIAIEQLQNQRDSQYLGLTWGYCALRALLLGDAHVSANAAHRAINLAYAWQWTRDIIQAEWLLGAALVALASEERGRRSENLSEAEIHLTEALTRCRYIDLIEMEPDILLAWARWHCAAGNAQRGRERAEEALAIADRCEYRLVQADAHLTIAQLALEVGSLPEARQHAEAARERAWCDGPPYRYEVAFLEAEQLLRRIEASA